MIKFIIIMAGLLGLVFVGYTLTEIEGRIIIDFAGTIIQASLLGGFIVVVIFALAIWLIWWVATKLLNLATGSRTWFGRISKRQQTQAFYQSINAMLINEQQDALKYIRKTQKGEFQGTNYLIAAELERQAGNFKEAHAYLVNAKQYSNAKPLALMKQAEMCLHNRKSEEAMDLLTNVEGKIRDSKAFVSLKLQILEGLHDWSQLQAVAKDNKKVLGDDYYTWATQWTTGEFAAIASKHGGMSLKDHWHQLSRSERKDQANQLVYLQLLIDQGLSNEAEKDLVAFASKQQHKGYWRLFKQLNHPNPTMAISFIEQEIKKQPENAELYSVLANLAYNTKDYELAKKAVQKALQLENSPADKALLACILEKGNEFEQANIVYKGLLK